MLYAKFSKVFFRSVPPQYQKLVLRAGGVFAIPVVLCAGVFLCWLFLFAVSWGPLPDSLSRTSVASRISRESLVYFSNGEAEIGGITQGEHHKYTPLSQIPVLTQAAFTSAEDRHFYKHNGIDILASFQALAEGLVHFEFRRAGSSITQQTVKNIVNHRERSFFRKWNEAVGALRIERAYSKNEILEMYLNQFYVVGNGHGIGVAARYYFGKKPAELNLVESAFIAATLKNPTRLNPLLQKTRDARLASEQAAFVRKNYVIQQMYENGHISKEKYLAALQEKMVFRPLPFQSEDAALLEMVTAELEELIESRPQLSEYSDVNLANSGLRIVTSLDEKSQRAAQRQLRLHLSRADMMLTGFHFASRVDFQERTSLRAGQFIVARVSPEPLVLLSQKGRALRVEFGSEIVGHLLPSGILECARRIAVASGRSLEDSEKRLRALLRPGRYVRVEVASFNPSQRTAEHLLHSEPKIEGALVAVQNGKFKAVAGGFDTSGFNRATQAHRQFGSVFKPILAKAALDLGWQQSDTLVNIPKAFPYGSKVYVPSLAHQSPRLFPTLAETLAYSENIATVSLLYGLLDKLNDGDFEKLVQELGLAPQQHEEKSVYLRRIARILKVSLAPDAVRAGLFQRQLQIHARKWLARGDLNDENRQRIATLWVRQGAEQLEDSRATETGNANDSLKRGWLPLASAQPKAGFLFSLFGIQDPIANFQDDVRASVAAQESTLADDPTGFKTLGANQEMRVALGLKSLVVTAHNLGIESRLSPVLSLPLGTSDTTLTEMAQAYWNMALGAESINASQSLQVFRSQETSPPTCVEKIFDFSGKLLFSRDERSSKKANLVERTRWLKALAPTTLEGTAKMAGKLVVAHFSSGSDAHSRSWAVPTYGKTGTTNDYRTASFVGLFPLPLEAAQKIKYRPRVLSPDDFSLQNGMSVATYVGYDRGGRLASQNFQGYGGELALPLWIDFANDVIAEALGGPRRNQLATHKKQAKAF